MMPSFESQTNEPAGIGRADRVADALALGKQSLGIVMREGEWDRRCDDDHTRARSACGCNPANSSTMRSAPDVDRHTRRSWAAAEKSGASSTCVQRALYSLSKGSSSVRLHEAFEQTAAVRGHTAPTPIRPRAARLA